MADFPLGALISAGASLFGQQSAFNRQADLSRQFAKKGIQWRVADAKAAGIHPLAALGAHTSVAPSMPVGGDAVAEGLGKVGDWMSGVGRERAELENQLLRSQIRSADAGTNAQVAQSRTVISQGRRAGQAARMQDDPLPMFRGLRIQHGSGRYGTDPGWSDAEDYETRHGEPADWAFFIPRAFDDLTYQTTGMPRRSNWNLLMHRFARGRDYGRDYRHR